MYSTMKKLIPINETQLPSFDELYVVSDLHLGGQQGFQIFNSGKEFNQLAQYLKMRSPGKKIALLINGDLVDFLAEKPAIHFDPEGAVTKLDRIVEDPAFSVVWNGLREFAGTQNRSLIITLGNHDLELALPWVTARLLEILSGGDEAARGRIVLVFTGTGFACKIGKAKVLCVHGNEVDEWNVADYETIRRIGRDIMQGRPVTDWVPNAGTQLVIDIMNNLKSSYPFIDLLKPEMDAVIPTLLALAPDQQDNILAIMAVARRRLWDKIKIATGFLGKGDKSPDITNSSPPDLTTLSQANFSFNRGLPSARQQKYIDDLLIATEARFNNNVDPVSLIDNNLAGQNLGLGSALRKLFLGDDISEVLREALEKLLKDRSFVLNDEDETFKRLDEQVGLDFNFVVAGHTHLERSIPRKNGNGFYFNSGTWVRLIQLKAAVLENKEKFKKVFDAFKAGTLATLDLFDDDGKLVQRRLTVASFYTEEFKTHGRLQHLNLETAGELLQEVAGSHFIYPQ